MERMRASCVVSSTASMPPSLNVANVSSTSSAAQALENLCVPLRSLTVDRLQEQLQALGLHVAQANRDGLALGPQLCAAKSLSNRRENKTDSGGDAQLTTSPCLPDFQTLAGS